MAYLIDKNLLFGLLLVLCFITIEKRYTAQATRRDQVTTPTTKLLTSTTKTRETARESNKGAVYAGIAAPIFLIVVFAIGLILLKRKNGAICMCKSDEKETGDKETTEITDDEAALPQEQPSTNCGAHNVTVALNNVVLPYILENNDETSIKNSSCDGPIYDTLEAPLYDNIGALYATVDESLGCQADTSSPRENNDVGPSSPRENNDERPSTSRENNDEGPSTSRENNDEGPSIYATINDGYIVDGEGYVTEGSICETSFLKEIYTSLKADKGGRENSIYASLLKQEDDTEKDALASLSGMDSTDQDYVFL